MSNWRHVIPETWFTVPTPEFISCGRCGRSMTPNASRRCVHCAGAPVRDAEDLRWMLDGLCTQTGPDAFTSSSADDSTAAKRVCNGNPHRDIEPCPVREKCLDYALRHRERHGIWGGKTEHERRGLTPNEEAA